MATWLRRLGPLLLASLTLGPALLFGYRAALRPFGQSAAEDGSQKLRGATTVGQTFVAPFDGLYRADVYLGPGGQARTGGVLFHLRAAPDAPEDLRSGVADAAAAAQRGGWVRLEFPPIPDSGGKHYYLSLTSGAPEGGTLAVFRSRQDRYRDGAYYLDGAPVDGDLAFLIYSRPGPISWLRGLGALLAQDKPSIWGSPALYGVLFIGYVILLGAALYVLAHEEPGGLEPEVAGE